MGQPRAITADDVLLRKDLASGGRVGDLLKSRVSDVGSSSTRWGGSRGAGRWWTRGGE